MLPFIQVVRYDAVTSYWDASTVQSKYNEGMQAKMFITFVIADAIYYHKEWVMYELGEFSPLNWIAPTYKNRLHSKWAEN